jgi:hypothetical protein
VARRVLLLPAHASLPGTFPAAIARMLGRADVATGGEAGSRAQLARHFDILPRNWAVAALTRRLDAGDAATGAWLRSDPAFVRPDINGARLLACGDGLPMDAADVDALLPALRPLFGDAGFPIDAPVPSRWYLHLPREARLPRFVPPEDALGADLFDTLPGEGEDTPEARRWRGLLSEVQVVLHNHPWNARRVARGLPPVNSLWFWGGGVAPDHVRARGFDAVATDDAELRALAGSAGCRGVDPGQADAVENAVLVDLRHLRSAEALAVSLEAHGARTLVLDFADGHAMSLSPGHRWRFWRRRFARFPKPAS